MVLRCSYGKPSACESRSRTRLPGTFITIEVVVADHEPADSNERLLEIDAHMRNLQLAR